jgi:hypothetical protein
MGFPWPQLREENEYVEGIDRRPYGKFEDDHVERLSEV